MVYLNDLIKEEHLYSEVDEERDSVIADMELIRERLAGILGGEKGQHAEKAKVNGEEKENITIIESHLAHYITDIVIVLRAYPPELKKGLKNADILKKRLTKTQKPSQLI